MEGLPSFKAVLVTCLYTHLSMHLKTNEVRQMGLNLLAKEKSVLLGLLRKTTLVLSHSFGTYGP